MSRDGKAGYGRTLSVETKPETHIDIRCGLAWLRTSDGSPKKSKPPGVTSSPLPRRGDDRAGDFVGQDNSLADHSIRFELAPKNVSEVNSNRKELKDRERYSSGKVSPERPEHGPGHRCVTRLSLWKHLAHPSRSV